VSALPNIFASSFASWPQSLLPDIARNATSLNPIFEMWLSEEIAAGRISALGWNDPVLRAAWLCCQWIGSPLPNIDPGKEAKARKDNLEMNLTTGERESRNHNGSSFKDNIAKNKKGFSNMPVPPWGTNAANTKDNINDAEDENG